MKNDLCALRDRLLGEIEKVSDTRGLQNLRVEALGKKSPLSDASRKLGSLPPEERRDFGALVHEVKTAIEAALTAREKSLGQAETHERLAKETIDTTLPGRTLPIGHSHPLTQTTERMVAIFTELGFQTVLGPDVETDFYNFQALNIPKDHPARDMQDTFWLDGEHLLRTHTSPVQIRTMQARKPPLRIIAPGAVYRCDSDVTHSPMFHQIEGLMVDEQVTFADLKGVLTTFLQRLFGRDLGVRFRPSFFPFTEPSCEVDIQCVFCRGKSSSDCRICKSTGYLEILGAGLVDPEVYRAVGYDPELSGFAFGVGVERVAMLCYGIDDIRHFYRSDVRFLRQF